MYVAYDVDDVRNELEVLKMHFIDHVITKDDHEKDFLTLTEGLKFKGVKPDPQEFDSLMIDLTQLSNLNGYEIIQKIVLTYEVPLFHRSLFEKLNIRWS